jgi:hypothetical protein
MYKFKQMKSLKIPSFIFSTVVFLGLNPVKTLAQVTTPKYEMTVTKEFYNNIVSLDSLFFDAYNRCNVGVMDSLMSKTWSFTMIRVVSQIRRRKQWKLSEKNICGKVTRELLKGSIEVYQINNYGAVEIGFHGFHNNQEKETGPTHFSKFVHIWRLQDNKWRITRVISLH